MSVRLVDGFLALEKHREEKTRLDNIKQEHKHKNAQRNKW